MSQGVKGGICQVLFAKCGIEGANELRAGLAAKWVALIVAMIKEKGRDKHEGAVEDVDEGEDEKEI